MRAGQILAAVVALAAGVGAVAQTTPAMAPSLHTDADAQSASPADASQELVLGTQLTRSGALAEAIPHLLAAQRGGADPYASGVNLAICYLGLRRYDEVLRALQPLRDSKLRTAAVENLLAQAYLGKGDRQAAYREFQNAAAATPKDERLYAYLADACTDHHDYALGLRIVTDGLKALPESARLHYEKALFLSRLGRFEDGKPEFARAAQLAPESDIGYLALVQVQLYEDDFAAANKLLHAAIATGHRDAQMLSLLGTVLLHEGAVPGQPAFDEAKAALEESAKEEPDYPATQIALGKMYLSEGRTRDAANHLELGRNLDPGNPAAYSALASAYRQLGERDKAIAALAELQRILAEKKTYSAATLP
jgi:tetratricopeptide (TPR) repeat protein